MVKFGKMVKYAAPAVLVLVALVPPVAVSNNLNDPVVGGVIKASADSNLVAYDRARTGFWNSVTANRQMIKPDVEYYIYEKLEKSDLMGRETWIRMAPITAGVLQTKEDVWIKWADDGKVVSEHFENYISPIEWRQQTSE